MWVSPSLTHHTVCGVSEAFMETPIFRRTQGGLTKTSNVRNKFYVRIGDWLIERERTKGDELR